jgi:hypothetical protein
MHAFTIVAYAYDAAMHCPACTREACTESVLRRDPTHPYASPRSDQNGIPGDACDREGNIVSPLFSCAVEQEETCDDCLSVIPGTKQD